jgi:hypothetical protein
MALPKLLRRRRVLENMTSSALGHGIATRVLLAVAAAATAAFAIAPAGSLADTCTAGSVGILVKKDFRLTTPMSARVVAECNDATYDAKIHGYVQIGSHRTGRVHTIRVTSVGQTPQRIKITLFRGAVDATRAYAKRHHRRYAYLRLFATSTVHGTDQNPIHYQLKLRVRVTSASQR